MKHHRYVASTSVRVHSVCESTNSIPSFYTPLARSNCSSEREMGQVFLFFSFFPFDVDHRAVSATRVGQLGLFTKRHQPHYRTTGSHSPMDGHSSPSGSGTTFTPEFGIVSEDGNNPSDSRGLQAHSPSLARIHPRPK
jgi:hypothetical protein